ncbi:MAG: rRNA pseudouridine synthase [Patescibacteria group bacterium]|nr:rRNA pseudouridine synthase [Patescibacteria group bacterium]
MRINKYLASQKIASRRGVDDLIRQKLVRINGRIAMLGAQVNEGDKVTVGKVVQEQIQKHRTYLAYNKPRGVVSHTPEEGQQQITDVVNVGFPVFPIGRLDRASRGLIILTNDGRITGRLLDPQYEHEKEYAVTVDRPLEKHFLRHLAAGMKIESEKTRPAEVKQTGENRFTIILSEGKRHQIRRMCAAFGYRVTDLRRTRIMNIKLGALAEGTWRKIEGDELKTFLTALGFEE